MDIRCSLPTRLPGYAFDKQSNSLIGTFAPLFNSRTNVILKGANVSWVSSDSRADCLNDSCFGGPDYYSQPFNTRLSGGIVFFKQLGTQNAQDASEYFQIRRRWILFTNAYFFNFYLHLHQSNHSISIMDGMDFSLAGQ
uniref:Uncharacterized protein n=1 Tax=Tetranychus urticae TaxID=32264 RepID=T1KSH5_TETUR